MYRSLRVRLLALVLIGIGILTFVDILVSNWGLVNIRDRAIAGSSAALRSQAETYLHKLALDRALSIDQTLNTIQQTTATTQRYLAQTRTPQPSAALAMQTAPTGQRYFYETTMVLLPVGAGDPHVLDDIAASSSLDALLPGLIQTAPEIDRISYLTPRGMMRTFPALNVARVPASWTVQADPSYQLRLKNRLEAVEWTQVHSSIDSAKQVISATAPIYRGTRLHGIVVVDVSLGQLTAALERMKVEQTGFAFLFDRDGRLIAASGEAQRRLSGRRTSSDAQGHAIADKQRLGPNLTNVRAGQNDVTTVDLDGKVYLLTYAQVLTLNWTLGLAVPLDEITATTATTTQAITGIADTTQTHGLLAALIAVGALGLVMSILLRRQFVQPLSTLIRATRAATPDSLHQVTVTSDDELGQLASAFNTMTAAIQASRAEIMAANQRLEQTVRERTADLELAVVKNEQALATQQELLRALREVSTPVIPIFAGVLVMPLIGQLDDERVRNATSALLTRIERDRTHTVLLDLTGVPLIDTLAAKALLQMAATSRLLGAEVLLVGIAPEIAQTIVALGVDMRGLHTAADMQSAVEQILTRRRTLIPDTFFSPSA